MLFVPGWLFGGKSPGHEAHVRRRADSHPTATQLDQLPEVTKTDELARLLRVSRKTLHAMFKKREILGGRRLGSVLRFSRKRVPQSGSTNVKNAARAHRKVRDERTQREARK